MPIQTAWLAEHVILTRWSSPLTYPELEAALEQLRIWAKYKGAEVDILLDIRQLDSLPSTYPYLMQRASDLVLNAVCQVAILGDERRLRRLAVIMAAHTETPFAQFDQEEEALAWLFAEES